MRGERRPPAGVLSGEWDPPEIVLDPPRPGLVATEVSEGVWVARDALSAADCLALRGAMEASGRLAPVSVQGRADMPDARVGSVRATAWAPGLGEQLWGKLRDAIPPLRCMSDTTPTDWHRPTEHRRWRPVGVSPVLRFMRYDAGGQHFGHYDASFAYPDGRRTLMSLVLYLTGVADGSGGRTRFLRDGQEHLPIQARDHDDWPREARADEVIAAVTPEQGALLLFDHRRCHDIELYRGATPRIIVRGDVVFSPADEL